MDVTNTKPVNNSERTNMPANLKTTVILKSRIVVDTGWAWMVLFGSILCHFFIIGQFGSFGVLYIHIQEKLDVSILDASVIGSLRIGFMHFVVVLTSPLANHLGCRRLAITGALLTTICYVISYLWVSIYTYYVFLGILTGVGNAMTYASAVIVVNNYFKKRAYFALAMTQAASSLGSTVLFPFVAYLLDEYDLYGTLLINAGLALNVVVGASLFVPQNAVINKGSQGLFDILRNSFQTYKDKWIWKNPIFYIALVSSTLNAFSTYISQLFADYLVSQNMTIQFSANILSLFSATATVSRVLVGIVTNKFPRSARVFYSGGSFCTGLTLCSFSIISSATSYRLVSIAYGFCFGCFTGLINVILVDLFGKKRLASCLGVTLMVNGVGFLTGTPLANAVAEIVPIAGIEFVVAGSIHLLSGIVMLPIVFSRKARSIEPVQESAVVSTHM